MCSMLSPWSHTTGRVQLRLYLCADAPWCGHCRQLEPQYADAAGKLKAEESAIRLAKVDAVEEKELAEEFEIKGFPTLKLFMDGDREHPVDFLGKRTLTSLCTCEDTPLILCNRRPPARLPHCGCTPGRNPD